ncbi:DnaB-like helicase N-terminal domain-containing protein, partial [Streptomyces alkaliphilus]|uniref:DnaB-like helicase N-terminal domain-containing protein n=1 Tax=Streptomyces alkaliphilus TaxID=1472722 RepID=UPI00119091D7
SPYRLPAPPPADQGPPHGQAVEEEQLLLATATAHPAEAERMRWLTPADFTLPLHAGLWRCLTSMARRRSPIDPVTVLWEAQQGGLLTSDIEPTELLGLLTEPVGSATYWGRRILQRALLTTAHHTGRHIEAHTKNPAIAPHHLLHASRHALTNFNSLRARWSHAASPSPPPSHPAPPTTPSRPGPPRTTPPTTTRITR